MKNHLNFLFIGIAILLVGPSLAKISGERPESANQTDHADTLSMWRADAESGSVGAQSRLCYMYSNGVGVSMDKEAAVDWCRLGAKQGDDSSQYLLGKAYRIGQGVARDPKEAARWFLASAQQGYSLAQLDFRNNVPLRRRDRERLQERS